MTQLRATTTNRDRHLDPFACRDRAQDLRRVYLSGLMGRTFRILLHGIACLGQRVDARPQRAIRPH